MAVCGPGSGSSLGHANSIRKSVLSGNWCVNTFTMSRMLLWFREATTCADRRHALCDIRFQLLWRMMKY